MKTDNIDDKCPTMAVSNATAATKTFVATASATDADPGIKPQGEFLGLLSGDLL